MAYSNKLKNLAQASREYDMELYETRIYKVFSYLFILVFVRLFFFIKDFLSHIYFSFVFVLCFTLSGHLFSFFLLRFFSTFSGSGLLRELFIFSFLDFLVSFFFWNYFFFLNCFWTHFVPSFVVFEDFFLFTFLVACHGFRRASLLSFSWGLFLISLRGFRLLFLVFFFLFPSKLECLHSYRKLPFNFSSFFLCFLSAIYFVLGFCLVYFFCKMP